MENTYGFGKKQADFDYTEKKERRSLMGRLLQLLNPFFYLSLIATLLTKMIVVFPQKVIRKFLPFLVKPLAWVFSILPSNSPINPFYLLGKRRPVAQFLRKRYENSKEDLLADRLDNARRNMFPEKDYPDLYMSLRSDVDPGIIVESRLVTGHPLKEMKSVYVTDELINESFNQARKDGLERVAANAIAFGLFLGVFLQLTLDINGVVYDAFEPWHLHAWGAFVEYMPFTIGMLLGIVLNPFLYVAACSEALRATIAAASKNLHVAVAKASMPFRRSTKQAKVAAKYTAAQRETERKDFIRVAQKNENYLKKVGMDRGIMIGTSTGEFRSRGVSGYVAPMPKQEVRLDLEALTKGVAVIGQTGSGKTSNVLLPMFKSLLAQRERGWMIMDGKSVLWLQCEKLVQKYAPERMEDMVVIGTGTYQGKANYGVDVLKGMRPSQVAENARSVMEQMASSTGGDDYWPTAAAQLIEHAARLAWAYTFTPEGTHYRNETGRSAYSLMYIYKIIKNGDERDRVGLAVTNTLKLAKELKGKSKADLNEKERAALILYSEDIDSLLNSVRYMCKRGTKEEADTFNGMSAGQKSGVLGGVDKMLGSLFSHKDLRRRFAEGRQENCIDVDGALRGKIVAVNISTEDTGNAGAFIMTLLKSRLYALAVLREREFKMKGLNPQIDAPVSLMIDEAQLFVSSSRSIGLDEGNALNILRSTGLSVIFGFQVFSSLIKRLGEDVANDLLAQLTNKIILANQDSKTIKWIVENSGESLRMRVHKDDEHENIWQSFFEHGMPSTPDELDAMIKEDPSSVDHSDMDLGYEITSPLVGIEEIDPYKPNSRVDQLINTMSLTPISSGGELTFKGLVGLGSGGKANNQAIHSAMIQEEYRREDKMEAYMTQGNNDRAVVNAAEISGLSEGKAWMTWSQGGIVRKDFIYLDQAIH